MKREVRGEHYAVIYDSETSTLVCEGSLRLYGATGYAEIIELFELVVQDTPEAVILDLKALQFLNSSGINALSKFVIKVRNQHSMTLTIQGSQQHPWQSKSLKNLQRLMPDLVLDMAD